MKRLKMRKKTVVTTTLKKSQGKMTQMQKSQGKMKTKVVSSIFLSKFEFWLCEVVYSDVDISEKQDKEEAEKNAESDVLVSVCHTFKCNSSFFRFCLFQYNVQMVYCEKTGHKSESILCEQSF